MITPIRSSLFSSLLLMALAFTFCPSIARAEDNQDSSWCVSSQVVAGSERTQRQSAALSNPLFLPMVAMLGNLPAPPATASILSQTPRVVRLVETLESGETCVTLEVINNTGHSIPRLSLEHRLKIDAGDALNARAFSDAPETISGSVNTAAGGRLCTFESNPGTALAVNQKVRMSCLYGETDDAVISSATAIHPRPWGGYDDNYNQIGDWLEKEGASRQGNDQRMPVLVMLDRFPQADDYSQFERYGGTVTYRSAQLPIFGGEITPNRIGEYVAAASAHLEIIGDDEPIDQPPYKEEVPSPDTVVATVPNMAAVAADNDKEYLSIAIVDTGVDQSHPALGKVVVWHDVLDPNHRQADDTDGHGSLVAGIAAGESEDFSGVAAGTQMVGIRHGTAGNWRISNFVKAIDWAIDQRIDERIIAINNSNVYTSGPAHHNPFWAAAATSAVESGLLFINSAGDGFADSLTGDTIGAPASEPKVLTVGAINADGNVTNFSSRGRNDAPDNAHQKPDVTAYGRNVRSARSSQTTATTDDEYAVESGTSLAAPYVTGQAALLAGSMSDVYKSDQDADDIRDEDGWDGIDNDGDGLIDEDPAPWEHHEVAAAAVKSLILMVTAEAVGGERLPAASPNIEDANDPHRRVGAPDGGWDRGGKDPVEGYGAVDISAAMEAVTREFCGYDTGSFSAEPGGQRVWARHLHLVAGKEYSLILEGPEDADYDLFLYQGAPDPYGEPIIARRPGQQGDPIVAKASQRADESISFQVRSDGLYYLVVRGVSGSGPFAVRLVTPETWTVLLYMPAELAGDANLDAAAFEVLNQLESVGSGQESTRDVQVLALVDYDVRDWQKDSQVQAADGSNGDSVLYCIRKDHRNQSNQYSVPLRPDELMDIIIDEQGAMRSEVDMGDPATLEKFASWAVDHFPAAHYGLVIWGDGDGYGWKTNPDAALGPGTDTRFGSDQPIDSQADALDLSELGAAVEQIAAKIEQGSSLKAGTGAAAKLDLLGFDIGQMAQIEVAAQVSDNVDILVAPQTNLTGRWPYAALLDRLTCQKSGDAWDCSALEAMDGENLARAIVDAFANPTAGEPLQVLSALRLGGGSDDAGCDTFAELIKCVDALATALTDGIQNGHNDPMDRQDNVQVILHDTVRTGADTSADRNYVDLRDLAGRLHAAGIDEQYRDRDQDIVDALTPGGSIVVALGSRGSDGPEAADLQGLSIYFPEAQLWPEGDCSPGATSYRCGYANPLPSPKLYAPDPGQLLPSLRNQNHPRPAQEQVRFVDETAWDEFLLRYYRPVAVPCLLREDGCTTSFTAQVGETVTLSAAGSSDIDSGTESSSVSAWIWDVDPEADHGAGLPDYGASTNTVVDLPCTEDCDRDEVDELDDDPDFISESFSWLCPSEGAHAMRLMVHDNHNQQPTIRGQRRTESLSPLECG